MENPTSASNDNFHNFLCYDNLPGIVIPQKVYLDQELHQEPKDVRTFLTFYAHETLGVVVSAQPGATMGVSLAKILAFYSKDLKATWYFHDPYLAPLQGLGLKCVLKWPGCFDYVPFYTKRGAQSLWTAANLAYEIAGAVRHFYERFEDYVDRRNPAPDWTPDRIPLDKLYLLELRQVNDRVYQPVLYYDAD
ncbi:hypothetical protein PHLGIDRAFT_224566 [Phlebiopsis gigantea 11061_1 CR5-6]|uniref:Uncharacterized protein n=1 Tax=Phlebiopsis gigantea (strain 11061_1 CR5-6) TaxID=745531 RepID=A0A0C3NGD4_PHLG1|nr:hypothetical protein PHLGIDRAFT_224566 [Phlebiopsis gigantea 11061_1 CR5-6]